MEGCFSQIRKGNVFDDRTAKKEYHPEKILFLSAAMRLFICLFVFTVYL